MMSYSVKQNSHFPVENDLMLKGTGKEIRTMLQKKINRELTVFLTHTSTASFSFTESVFSDINTHILDYV